MNNTGKESVFQEKHIDFLYEVSGLTMASNYCCILQTQNRLSDAEMFCNWEKTTKLTKKIDFNSNCWINVRNLVLSCSKFNRFESSFS